MTELGTIVNPRVADAEVERKVRREVFVEVFVLVLMSRVRPSLIWVVMVRMGVAR
jgi:hypothetical protein